MLDKILGGNYLVTGGTGSLGQAVVRRLLGSEAVERVVVFSRGWQEQEQMRAEMSDPRLRFFIGDVRDVDRLKLALQGIEYVIHAAAMKSVPACEYNPSECIETNVVGTENVLAAARSQRVKKVLTISSDKSCEPINVYGKSKALAESLAVAANVYAPKMCINVARYGNVAGSSGSVIGNLYRQIAYGSAVSITDVRMTRFWVTMQAAVSFVVDSLIRGLGGEIFVPKLKSAEVVRVADSISRLLKIKTPDVDEVGIRVGEKLHEKLVASAESRLAYDAGWACVILPETLYWDTGRKRPPPDDNFPISCYSSDTAERLSDSELDNIVLSGIELATGGYDGLDREASES